MRLSITFNHSDKVLSIDVSDEMTLADLIAYIEVEAGAGDGTTADGGKDPSLVLVHNSKPMTDTSKPLSFWELEDDDMIVVFDAVGGSGSSSALGNLASGNSDNGASTSISNINIGAAAASSDLTQLYSDVEKVRQQILHDSVLREGVKQRYPQLIEVVNDQTRFRDLMISIEKERVQHEDERRKELKRLQDDPYNEESQRKILELIQEEAIMDNLNTALEHSPEVFGSVTMLFVPILVNGKKMKAFVDSGAQATVISYSCVEACNLTHLIDRRFQGVAVGVGTAKIIGRIHSAPIKVGNSFFPCSFTVMEGERVDLLLGLDMLKRHQACIDLKRGLLVFGDSEVEFLGESEIPSMGPALGKEDGPDSLASARAATSAGGSVSTGGLSSARPTGSASSGSGSSLAAASSVPPPASLPAAERASFPEDTIQTLVALGFSRQQAIQALQQAGGNPELAAAMLFQ